MCGNAERSDRRRTVNVARKTKFLARRIVMIAEKIVCLDNIDIVDLCCPQDLACTFRSGNVRSGPHLPPAAEGGAHPNLRPKPNEHCDAELKQPTRSKTQPVRIKHVALNLAR